MLDLILYMSLLIILYMIWVTFVLPYLINTTKLANAWLDNSNDSVSLLNAFLAYLRIINKKNKLMNRNVSVQYLPTGTRIWKNQERYAQSSFCQGWITPRKHALNLLCFTIIFLIIWRLFRLRIFTFSLKKSHLG